MRKILKYLKPWDMVGSSCATVFGVEVYGDHDRPKWHPINVIHKVGQYWENRVAYPLMWRYHPKHQYNKVHTRLKPGYYDQETRMLHACFALLEDYVEELYQQNENPSRSVLNYLEHCADDVFEYSEEQARNYTEIAALYRWWKVTRPANHAHKKVWAKALFSGRAIWNPVNFEGTQLYEYMGIEGSDEIFGTISEYHAYTQQLNQDDQEMLIRLVTIREFLWV